MIEFPIVIELAKALAPTVAAGIAATAAIYGFRFQRRLDRRMEWYAAFLEQLGALHEAIERAARMPQDAALAKTATEAMDRVYALTVQGMMYVDKRGARALEQWHHAFSAAPKELSDAKFVEAMRIANADVAISIVEEGRAKLGLRNYPRGKRVRAGDGT